jgi:hypothetical protein
MDPRPIRNEPLMPNVGFVARREYVERIRSKMFYVSTLVLAGLRCSSRSCRSRRS